MVRGLEIFALPRADKQSGQVPQKITSASSIRKPWSSAVWRHGAWPAAQSTSVVFPQVRQMRWWWLSPCAPRNVRVIRRARCGGSGLFLRGWRASHRPTAARSRRCRPARPPRWHPLCRAAYRIPPVAPRCAARSRVVRVRGVNRQGLSRRKPSSRFGLSQFFEVVNIYPTHAPTPHWAFAENVGSPAFHFMAVMKKRFP